MHCFLGQKALQKQCEIRFGCLKIRRKSDWRPIAAVIPTYFVLEFNMNRRIRNKSYEEAKLRDILRPGKTHAGTPDTEAELRDVPGNTGRLASLTTKHAMERMNRSKLSFHYSAFFISA